MGQKLRAEQHGVFPISPERGRFSQLARARALAQRAGLPTPERPLYSNLGNRSLPVYEKKQLIQKNIRDHQISMVEGATGSGKSTQIAQYALEMGYRKIVYLEPRVLLADNLSDRIEQELSDQLGKEQGSALIGVRHSERSTGHGKTIEVMTPGTYMRLMDELRQYDDEPVLIVGDEIHEKDFETELAVALSVKRLAERPKWRMVLASATLDAEAIHEAYTEMNGRAIPRTMVEGRPHELTIIEEPELTADQAYEKYGRDHKKTIMFTAGKTEIHDTVDKLYAQRANSVRFDPLHAKLSRRDIKQATHAHLKEGQRQGIVSTPAGQSGITIPELTLAILDGTVRRPDLSEDAVEGLFKQYAAQDELVQQGGRAGRDVTGGVVVYVKPDDEAFQYKPFEDREKQAPAQIYHTNISGNVLLTTSLGEDFHEMNKYLLHKVDARTILGAYDVLYRLQAIDEYNKITDLGKRMNRFPLRPELSRVVVEAMQRNASREILQHIAAMVSAVGAGGLPYFENGVGDAWRSDIRETTKDDYLAQLDMFYATRGFYNGVSMNEAELEARNYDLKNTEAAHKTFDKIARELGLGSRDIDCTSPSSDELKEMYDCLTAGLFDFAHRHIRDDKDGGQYVSLHDVYGKDERKLSDRGTYKASDELVLGMPRRFEKRSDGELVEHNVIENVMPTTIEKLAQFVAHLTVRKPVTRSSVVGGRLEMYDALYFGELRLGEVPSVSRLTHTPETRKQLTEAAYRKPTQTIDELTSIKKILEHFVRLTPNNELSYYFPAGILTEEWLETVINDAIDNDVDSIYSLDNKLRTRLIRGNISLRTWLSEDKERELTERSPEFIDLRGGGSYQLYYSHGKPIINGFNLKDADNLSPDHLFLPDGREVLISYRIDRDTKRYTSGEIKAYAKTLD